MKYRIKIFNVQVKGCEFLGLWRYNGRIYSKDVVEEKMLRDLRARNGIKRKTEFKLWQPEGGWK